MMCMLANLFWVNLLSIQLQTFASFDYFESKIDFWEDLNQEHPKKPEKRPKEDLATGQVNKSQDKKSQQKKSFDWDAYLDPENDEFFKEGDYLPPAPFMEVARRPTDENIRLWFQYLEQKNQLSQRLQKKLAQFAQPQEEAPSRVDPKDWRIVYYFDSRCQFCNKMFSTIYDLQSQGFFVEARQVDDQPVLGLKIVFDRASRAELLDLNIDAVPVLLAEHRRTGTKKRFQGFQTTQTILEKL